MSTSTKVTVKSLLLEFRYKLEDAHVNIYTDGVPLFFWLRTRLTAMLEEMEREVEAKKCDERKAKYFGGVTEGVGIWVASTHDEKSLVNAALDTALQVIVERKV